MYTPTRRPQTGHDYHVPTGTDLSASRFTNPNPGTQFYDTHGSGIGPTSMASAAQHQLPPHSNDQYAAYNNYHTLGGTPMQAWGNGYAAQYNTPPQHPPQAQNPEAAAEWEMRVAAEQQAAHHQARAVAAEAALARLQSQAAIKVKYLTRLCREE